jgi:hypothetical protein
MSGLSGHGQPFPHCPLVVAYGLGVNSTAMLVEFARRGIKPDLILFADTGGEKPETYAYLPVIQRYLSSIGFPPVVTVRYQPKRARYRTLEGQCLATGTLPSLAYGGKTCSLKFKRSPQDKFILARWPPPLPAGRRVVRAIGFDAGESRRTFADRVVKAIGLDAGEQHRLTWARPGPGARPRPSRERWLDERYFAYWYPLLDWGLDRAACVRIIESAGLPVPPKSACFFCPASKKPEILDLKLRHPELLKRALALEANARPKLRTVRGLGRSFAWADFLRRADTSDLFAGGCG